MEIVLNILTGFARNISIAFIAYLIPFLLGALLSFLASKFRVAEKIFLWLSLPFECICPLLLILAIFYISGMNFGIQLDRMLAVIITLPICFVGYMPSRYNSDFSLLKNILYNGLGLMSCLLKWSFCARIIAVADMTYEAEMMLTRGITWPLLLAIFISTFVIGIVEIAKRAVKQFMK